MEGVRRTPGAPACAGGSEACWRRRREECRSVHSVRQGCKFRPRRAESFCCLFVCSLCAVARRRRCSRYSLTDREPSFRSASTAYCSTTVEYLSGRSYPAVSARMCRVPTLSGPQCAPAAVALGRFTSRAFRVRQGSRTCPLRLKLAMIRAVRPPLYCTAHDRTGVTAAAATIAERRCMEVWAAWRCRKRSA
jgi:hypothetical protein